MTRLTIFDFDGTLCMTHEAIACALTDLFDQRLSHRVDPDHVTQLIGRGIALEETLREIHPVVRTLSDEALHEWQRHYRAIYQDVAGKRAKLFPDAVETVAECARLGAVAIVSNKGKTAVETSLSELGLAVSSDFIFADDGVAPKKPSASLYSDVICEVFPDAVPESTIMVGDTATDLRFAKNAGIIGCWATYGYGDDDDCRAIGSRFQISALAELIPIVRDL